MSKVLDESMSTAMDKLRSMVDANSVVGDPIVAPDGTMIIPISKIHYGFGTGGGDIPNKEGRDLYGAGVGGGVTVTPTAFLHIKTDGDVKLIQVEPYVSSIDRIVEKTPDFMQKVGSFFGGLSDKKKNKKQDEDEEIDDLDNLRSTGAYKAD